MGYASHDSFAILDAQQWRKSRRFRVIAAEYDELRPREVGLDHRRRSTSRSSSSFLGLQASDIGTELEGGARRQVTLTSSEEKILRVLKALEKEEGAPFLLQHVQQRTIHDSRLFADRSRETNERRRTRTRNCKVLQHSGCGL
jgi:hypothetical protein